MTTADRTGREVEDHPAAVPRQTEIEMIAQDQPRCGATSDAEVDLRRCAETRTVVNDHLVRPAAAAAVEVDHRLPAAVLLAAADHLHL